MNKKDRGILYGMLLGDGNLYQATNNFGTKYVKLTIGHSPKQKDYLEHKINLLFSIFGGSRPKVYEYSSLNKSRNRVYKNIQTIKTSTYFKQMHRNLYPTGVKKFTRKVLDYLTDEGLAIWFMDDGSGHLCKNKQGKICGLDFRISTYCSLEEANIIKDWFKDRYNIDSKLILDKRNNKYSIKFNTQPSIQLFSIISPYVIDSMRYKIDIVQERQTSLTKDDDIVQT